MARQSQVLTFTKGMMMDNTPKFQDGSSYRWAYNAVLFDPKNSKSGSLSSEADTMPCFEGLSTLDIVGTLYTTDNNVVYFLYNPNTGVSSIELLNLDTKDRTLILNDAGVLCLNFNPAHPIKASVYRTRKNCDRIIYFTDGVNPVRVVNLDSPEQYYRNGLLDCNLLQLSKDYIHATFTNPEVLDSGGQLEVGSYKFVWRYLDADFNPTNWFVVNEAASVVTDDSLSGDDDLIDGAMNAAYYSVNEGGVARTTKSIRLTMSSVDTSFSYIEIAAIQFVEGLGSPTRVSLFNRSAITEDTLQLVANYTGSNSQILSTLTTEEVTIPQATIKTAQAMTSHDNSLWLGNIQYKEHDYSDYQKYASKICVDYTAIPVAVDSGKNYGDAKSEQPYTLPIDEIVALGIVYVFPDGEESPVFHIPGRPAMDAGDDLLIIARTDYALVDQDGTEDLYIGVNGNVYTEFFTHLPQLVDLINADFPGLASIYIDDAETKAITFDTTSGHPAVIDYAPLTPITPGRTQIFFYEEYNSGSSGTGEYDILSTWHTDMEPWVSEADFNTNYAKSEIEHTNFPAKPILRKYQVYNTCTATKCGYYETDTTYPDYLTCEGESIWGVDCEGNPLAGKFIRHHRLPNRNFLMFKSIVGGITYTYVPQLNFSNIEIPPGAIGYYIVISDAEAEKTIVDKGPMFGTFEVSGTKRAYSTFREAANGLSEWEHPYSVVHAPKALVQRAILTGDYIHIEGIISGNSGVLTYDEYDTPGFLSGSILSAVRTEDFNNYSYTTSTLFDKKNLRIEGTAIVEKGATQIPFGAFTQEIINQDFSFPAFFVKLPDYSGTAYTITGSSPGTYSVSPIFMVSIKNTEIIFRELSTITYRKLTPNIQYGLTTSEAFVAGTAKFSWNLFSIWGDPGDTGFLDGATVKAVYFKNLISESSYNLGLRHGGTTFEFNYYKETLPYTEAEYLVNKVAEKLDNGDYDIRNEIYEEYYGFNPDFYNYTITKPYFGLGRDYDYCKSCEDSFPYRVTVSEIDTGESVTDDYLVFKANNYIDIQSLGSPITSMHSYNNTLYYWSEDSVFGHNTGSQELQADTATVLLGTAARLAAPVQRLSSVQTGSYGGTLHPFSVIQTPYGIFYVDVNSLHIFKLGQSLMPISLNSINSFLSEDGDIRLTRQFKALGLEYDLDGALSHKNGVGYISFYDPYYKRVVFSKIDYEVKDHIDIDTYDDKSTFEDFTVYYSYATNKFYFKENGIMVETDVSDSSIFTDKSFTISYSVLGEGSWVSFHDHRLSFAYNNGKNNMFVQKGTNITRKIGANNLYNGTSNLFSVVSVFNDNPLMYKTVNSIQFDLGHYSVLPNKLSMFGENYNSTVQTLVPYSPLQSINPVQGETLYRKINDTIKVSDLRDVRTNETDNGYVIGDTGEPIPITIATPNLSVVSRRGRTSVQECYIKLELTNTSAYCSLDNIVIDYNLIKR